MLYKFFSSLSAQNNFIASFSTWYIYLFIWIWIYSFCLYFYLKLPSKSFRIIFIWFVITLISFSLFFIFIKKLPLIPLQILLIGLPFILLGKILKKDKRKKQEEYSKIFKENKIIHLDLRLAKNIQEALFPKLEPIHGLIYDVYRQSQNQLGGDFFDFIKLREGNVGIFMTDVAGHGVSSAMIAAMIKVLVSTMPYVYKQDPSALLTYLDNKMTNDYKSEHATAIYIFVNFQTRTITLANAGHPYLIYQKKGESFQEIETQGSLLGYGIQNPIAINYSFPYSTGDRFIVYTDGLIEDFNSKGEYLGPEGFLKILNTLINEPTQTFKEKLIVEICSFYQKTIFVDDAMFMIFELE